MVVTDVRERVARNVRHLFTGGVEPLDPIEDHPGDPGLFGPESASWRVLGDVSAVVGAIAALLTQATHPEVAAGVADHSNYRDDPLGRLARTSHYVTKVTFGARDEVSAAIDGMRAAHRHVRGTSERGRPYDASDPLLAGFVHHSLTWAMGEAYVRYGHQGGALDRDRFVAEQALLGDLLGIAPRLETWDEVCRYLDEHADVAPSGAMREAFAMLRNPPLEPLQQVGYKLAYDAAIDMLRPATKRASELTESSCASQRGQLVVGVLRAALGTHSPSFHKAQERCGLPSTADGVESGATIGEKCC